MYSKYYYTLHTTIAPRETISEDMLAEQATERTNERTNGQSNE